jgi:flagellar motor protein MotB
MRPTFARALALAILAGPASSPPAAIAGDDKSALLHVPGPLEWEPGTERPKRGSETVMIFVAEYLRARPEVTKLRIETHAATEADGAANQKLSDRRAYFIARWLLAHGVDCKRLTVHSFGSTKPAADNNRTVFQKLEIRGKPLSADASSAGSDHSIGDVCQIKP